VTYLFDNNISPRLARMLAALGIDAKPLRDIFPQDIKDIDFLPQLRDTGWVLVTGDTSIVTRRAEAIALRKSGVSALFLGPFWLKLTLWPQATWLVTRWPEIDAFMQNQLGSVYVELRQRGRPRFVHVAG